MLCASICACPSIVKMRMVHFLVPMIDRHIHVSGVHTEVVSESDSPTIMDYVPSGI